MSVRVRAGQGGRPPDGSSLIVQLRDTSVQDAPATILGEKRGKVGAGGGDLLATIEVDAKARGVRPEVWAHVDVDGDGRVSRGDYVTMQSYPIPDGARPVLEVTVNRV